jgi:hypothetical protein
VDCADNQGGEILEGPSTQGVRFVPHKPRFLVGILDKLNFGGITVSVGRVRRDTKWTTVLVPSNAGRHTVTINWGMMLTTNGYRTVEVNVSENEWVEVHAKPRLLRSPFVWIGGEDGGDDQH